MTTHQAPTYAELNAILDRAARPSRTPAEVGDAQLLGVQHRWTTMLSARLDQAIEDADHGKLAEATADAWRRLSTEQPVLRGILDAGLRRSKALVDALDGELRILALAAGLVGIDSPDSRAVRVGRKFRDSFTGVPAPLHQVA
jgi:hypothetical protein